MPPRRFHNHRITVKPGDQPTNTRPYRYGFTQKVEIEKQVKHMMLARVIRPSTILTPVPFCVDYSALNSISIPDKYPIPAIDELLDELGGTIVFTKLAAASQLEDI